MAGRASTFLISTFIVIFGVFSGSLSMAILVRFMTVYKAYSEAVFFIVSESCLRAAGSSMVFAARKLRRLLDPKTLAKGALLVWVPGLVPPRYSCKRSHVSFPVELFAVPAVCEAV
jgi:uncharacterized membrane protein YjjP (DUF1212 family)